MLLVNALNFQWYLLSLHLATLIVAETVVNGIPNSQTLKYFCHFTKKILKI
jgi:hypothetical protein